MPVIYIAITLTMTILLALIAGRFLSENDEKGTVMGLLCLIGSVCFAGLLMFVSMQLTRGTISGEQQTLVQCGLREGVVYKTETTVGHTEYRELVVVRDESDLSHRACMIGGYLPDRFVVVDGEAVTVDEGSTTLGDTEYEERERRRQEERSMMMGPEEEIVVTGQSLQE